MKIFKLIVANSYLSIYYWLRTKKRLWNLNNAIRRADNFHKVTGKQYFVIPVGSLKYTCVSNMDKDFFAKYAKKNGTPKLDYMKILEIAAYKTPTGTYSKR